MNHKKKVRNKIEIISQLVMLRVSLYDSAASSGPIQKAVNFRRSGPMRWGPHGRQ